MWLPKNEKVELWLFIMQHIVFDNILIAFNIKKKTARNNVRTVLILMIFGCYFTAIKRAII